MANMAADELTPMQAKALENSILNSGDLDGGLKKEIHSASIQTPGDKMQ
jgi:hypothetical protein